MNTFALKQNNHVENCALCSSLRSRAGRVIFTLILHTFFLDLEIAMLTFFLVNAHRYSACVIVVESTSVL